MKQFGFNLDEVLRFADFQTDYAAIMRVDIPTSALKDFSVTFGQIDPFIFKSGVFTVEGQGGLNLLNKTVDSIVHAY